MNQALTWTLKAFTELTTQELYQLLQLRQAVFVVEQTCPYLDADGADTAAFHLWASDSTGDMVAYARLFLPSASANYSRIGRVISASNVRGQGLGRELMRRALAWCQQHAPQQPIRLGAQVYLRDFYRSFGFVEISSEYLEDDIPHVDMERAR